MYLKIDKGRAWGLRLGLLMTLWTGCFVFGESAAAHDELEVRVKLVRLFSSSACVDLGRKARTAGGAFDVQLASDGQGAVVQVPLYEHVLS